MVIVYEVSRYLMRLQYAAKQASFLAHNVCVKDQIQPPL